jgi:regulator of PEP synthase PpsR (kinase-PPPase family)
LSYNTSGADIGIKITHHTDLHKNYTLTNMQQAQENQKKILYVLSNPPLAAKMMKAKFVPTYNGHDINFMLASVAHVSSLVSFNQKSQPPLSHGINSKYFSDLTNGNCIA